MHCVCRCRNKGAITMKMKKSGIILLILSAVFIITSFFVDTASDISKCMSTAGCLTGVGVVMLIRK